MIAQRSRRVGATILGVSLLVAAPGCERGASPVATNPTTAPPLPAIDGVERLDPEAARLIEELLAAARARPDSAEARGRLAAACHANGLPALAAVLWAQALTIDATRPAWWQHLATARASGGDLDGALDAIDRSIELDDRFAPAHARRGFWLLDLGRPEEADAAFRIAIEADAQCINARLGRARILIDRGEAAEARAILEPILRTAPQERYARFLLGSALRDLGEDEAARRELAAGAGGTLQWTGRDPRAAEIQQAWRGLRASIARAEALIAARRTEEAATLLASLAIAHPDDVVVANLRYSALLAAGRTAEADRVLGAAVARHPDHFALRLNASSAALRLGRSREALDHAERAVALKPGLAEAQRQLGAALAASGRAREAEEALRRAWELDPLDPEAPRLLVAVQHAEGRAAEAFATLRRWREVAPDLPQPWIVEASVLWESGRRDEARRLLEEAAQRFPGDRSIANLLRTARGG